jgi:hypothetical protein
MILRETEKMVSTKDGKPLDPEAKGVVYPWNQIGVLRHVAAQRRRGPWGLGRGLGWTVSKASE